MARMRKTLWLCQKHGGGTQHWQVAAFSRKDVTYRSTVWFQEFELTLMRLGLNKLIKRIIEQVRKQ